MSLGTKNRLKQNAEACKAHLRAKYPDEAELVEEFIVEIEGPEESQDVNGWTQFTDVKGSTSEMLGRVDDSFAAWLNP